MIHVRNDVLIALKEVNKPFFEDYLRAYHEHIQSTYQDYYQPTRDTQAQNLASQITMSTNSQFFTWSLPTLSESILKSHLHATFGNYTAETDKVHCSGFLHYARNQDHASTWLPQGEYLDEKN